VGLGLTSPCHWQTLGLVLLVQGERVPGWLQCRHLLQDVEQLPQRLLQYVSAAW